MTSEQIDLVQVTFDSIDSQDKFAELFYSRLFLIAPEVRTLFPRDLAVQRGKLTQMLTVAVANLGHPDRLLPIAQELGRRHAQYGAVSSHYESVGAALLWALEQVSGVRFTAEVRDAWTATYLLLSRAMQDAAPETRAPQSPDMNPRPSR